ncbi:MAG: RNA polymerase-binding protein DksA [Alphaproteobacteria bacterium]|nr:RNA polymerase-binding protein DksA [Alphaproteobacteria bacterium]
MTKKDYKTLELDSKYIPKKNEEYMSNQQKAYFYRLLSDQRDELVASMDNVMQAVNLGRKNNSAGVGDDADSSNFDIEADIQLRLHERSFNLLKKIDLALERMEKGTFGYSVISGEEIGIRRMLARPLATLTLEEQEEVEKKEK